MAQLMSDERLAELVRTVYEHRFLNYQESHEMFTEVDRLRRKLAHVEQALHHSETDY